MSRGWRYFATRLNGDGTETGLHRELPLRGVSIEHALSAPGSIDATISPEFGYLRADDGALLLEEWGTAIYAESEGLIRAAGILVASDFDGPEWSLECAGFTYYGKDMPYVAGGAKYVNVDALDIARAIWAHIQGRDGQNIGLEFDQQDSGVRVGSELTQPEYDPAGGQGGLTLQTQAFKLAYYQNHDLLSDFDGLAQDTPFDYVERHFWDGDTVRHRVDFGVPRFGRRRTDLRFAIGENIFVTPTVARDGDDWASDVYMLGAGEGASTIRGYAGAPRRGRLRRPRVVSDPSIRRLSRANSAAAVELKWRNVLDDIDSVIVRNKPHAPIGSVELGDEIRIQGKMDWIDIDAWYRVTAIRFSPDDSDSQELSVTRTDRLS